MLSVDEKNFKQAKKFIPEWWTARPELTLGKRAHPPLQHRCASTLNTHRPQRQALLIHHPSRCPLLHARNYQHATHRPIRVPRETHRHSRAAPLPRVYCV